MERPRGYRRAETAVTDDDPSADSGAGYHHAAYTGDGAEGRMLGHGVEFIPPPTPEPHAGPFVGVGPRGYQRSDKRIYEDICDRLSAHSWLDASDVEVEVHEGEVRLRGTVNTTDARADAGRLTASVYGVVHVVNDLEV